MSFLLMRVRSCILSKEHLTWLSLREIASVTLVIMTVTIMHQLVRKIVFLDQISDIHFKKREIRMTHFQYEADECGLPP